MSEQENPITLRRDGAVAIVHFERSSGGNALNQQGILQLTQIARDLRDDCDARAVVLTGTRKAFSAGVDLKEAIPRPQGAGAEIKLRRRYERGAPVSGMARVASDYSSRH